VDPHTELPVSPGHPFYVRLNEILDAAGFARFVEEQCRPLYAPVMGRPASAPGRYFAWLLVGLLEARLGAGIAWRAADSLRCATSLAWGSTGAPDHSTISPPELDRCRGASGGVPTVVQERLGRGHLLRGKTLAVDARPSRRTPRCGASAAGHGGSYQKFSPAGRGLRPQDAEPRALARLDRGARSGRPTEWE